VRAAVWASDGGSESDVIMLVMNERGAAKLSSEVHAGWEARWRGTGSREASAQTDAKFQAEILSGLARAVVSRAFLCRARLGRTSTTTVICGELCRCQPGVATPRVGTRLTSLLTKYSSAEKK